MAEWKGWQGEPYSEDLVQVDDHDGTTPRQYEKPSEGHTLAYMASDYATWTDISYTPGGGASRTFQARFVTAEGQGEWEEFSWPWLLPIPPN